ncbi:cytochrome b/b6 domain-containing protein [Curvibacter sp. CHRR-16]|uniref:cytochrome b n=1 Tax=Curvibacter sp. CHRR-16 TaxID=2835872 RepID=UPI001BDB1DD5|nr:cytochrome b/b6 domain-containing protein [Curvibacter sp. CHRR-16]MBT0569884.1 cytochrome b/b6 domain-containing protein [Curvibacter sp. CHRR-16]
MQHTTSTPRTTYDGLSRLLHWITALAVLVAFVLGPEGFGRLVSDGEDPAQHIGIVLHETLGMLVLALTVVRLLWATVRPSAPHLALAPAMHYGALVVRLALWVLLLALPITALFTLASEGYPLTLLGGLRIDEMPWLAQLGVTDMLDWGDVHSFLGDTIMVLAGLHAVAAIFHHAVLKDGVLVSMLPWLDKK